MDYLSAYNKDIVDISFMDWCIFSYFLVDKEVETNKMLSFLLFVGELLLLLYATLFIHELIHYLFIRLFQKKVVKIEIGIISFSFHYENDGKFLQIAIISLGPAIIMLIIGFVLLKNGETLFNGLAGFLFLVQAINLFPITTDGKVGLYCILKLLEKRRCKR